jgi:hypothetical protein
MDTEEKISSLFLDIRSHMHDAYSTEMDLFEVWPSLTLAVSDLELAVMELREEKYGAEHVIAILESRIAVLQQALRDRENY